MGKEAAVLTSNGSNVALNEEALGALQSNIRGKIIVKSDGEEYDKARQIWNAMIDRSPGLIVVCTGTSDVVACVKFAREHKLCVSVRGGGHNIAGKALLDDAMLIDLSMLRHVTVLPDAKTAWVAPGALLGDVDHATEPYGLALPMGINSTTGISGLALGGGWGWISRKFGTTSDHIVAAEVVQADGTILHCNKDKEPELFWAIRGGGGNFGVVTNLCFMLREVGPEVQSGPIIFGFEEAKQVLQGLANLQEKESNDLTTWVVIRQCPPFPFVGEEHHFKPVVVVAGCYIGPKDKTKEVMAPYRALGTPIGDAFGPHPLKGWNAAFDGLLTPGARNYWKTHNLKTLSDGMIDELVAAGTSIPNFGSEIFCAHLGGAMNEVPVDETAYANRDHLYTLNIHTRWNEKEDDAANLAWCRSLYDKCTPFASGSQYVNFVSDGDENTEATYGGNLKRLQAAKKHYDPDNFFSVNYNVRPTDA